MTHTSLKFDKADRIIDRAAKRIAAELDRIASGLPDEVAESYALDRLARRLLEVRPSTMQHWIKHGRITERSFVEPLLADVPLNALLEERRSSRER
jgi:hypothetical protein